MSVFHDEIEIEDMEYDEDTETYYYPCPCGDRFEITKVYGRTYLSRYMNDCGTLARHYFQMSWNNNEFRSIQCVSYSDAALLESINFGWQKDYRH